MPHCSADTIEMEAAESSTWPAPTPIEYRPTPLRVNAGTCTDGVSHLPKVVCHRGVTTRLPKRSKGI